MAKKIIGLYKENTFSVNNDIKFLNIECRTRYPLTNFEDQLGLRASVIFLDPQYVWFPSHVYVGLIPNSSGQLAELIFVLFR